MAGVVVIAILMSLGMMVLMYFVTKKAYSRKWDEEE
ncbi:hypothetical protein PAECIP111890_03163 [Paenibacillus sp. JJ-223]|nr:hypothetical protein PAECIP111890_03163 [Paenibacillus sp. JJ-223]